MAIGDGSWVTPNTVVGTALNSANWLAQPPTIGVASGQSTPFAVLWDNGVFDAAIPEASLLQIDVPSTPSTLVGQVVRSTQNNQSAEFIGTVVFLGSIDLGAGAFDFAIVKSAGPGHFFWAAALADLAVVAGR
jgi:hypothetical protein